MTTVPHTTRALREFWRRHQQKLYAVPVALYDELDRLIRADERRQVMEGEGVLGLAQHYDEVVGENARLLRKLEARHILGGCPHCSYGGPAEPIPGWWVPVALATAVTVVGVSIVRAWLW
jgi:hypothetical protein